MTEDDDLENLLGDLNGNDPPSSEDSVLEHLDELDDLKFADDMPSAPPERHDDAEEMRQSILKNLQDAEELRRRLWKALEDCEEMRRRL